jgi:hypothetical protein
MINERTLRDCIPYDERERPVYDLLSEARELLGRAHDKIADASMNYRGNHHKHLVGVCPAINDLIEKLHDACSEGE